MIVIRKATPQDAEEATEVMRRSITELCQDDHQNDPKVLGSWLNNKRPEVFRSWLEESSESYFVAIENGRIQSVGAVANSGLIILNYVSPDARFRGVSRIMLAALEQRAREQGNRECRLASTATARRFYASCGYVEAGAPEGLFGSQSGFPMRKTLL